MSSRHLSESADNPVKNAVGSKDLLEVLDHACRTRRLSARGARLLHHYNNAVFHLPEERAVARVNIGRPVREPLKQTAARELVHRYGIAATKPLGGIQPVVSDATTCVSFWVFYPQPDPSPLLTSVHLASILRKLHDIDHLATGLDTWQPLWSLTSVLSDPAYLANLPAEDRDWLPRYVVDVREQVSALESPLGHGVVHGDAWAGNLLWDTVSGATAAVLGDWDSVSIGPREIDLIPTWHAAVRYGKGPEWADAFARVYGVDLRAWDGYQTLLRMRDLAQLSGPIRRAKDNPVFAQVLHERITGIRDGDHAAVWRAL